MAIHTNFIPFKVLSTFLHKPGNFLRERLRNSFPQINVNDTVLLFLVSFPEILDHPILGIDFRGETLVDEEGSFHGNYIMAPLVKEKVLNSIYPREFSVGFKLYVVPFTHKTKPIFEGRISNIPFPADEVKLSLNKRAQNDAPAPKVAKGRYVFELNVKPVGFRQAPAFKAFFFTIKGEWFAASKEVDFSM